MKFKTVFSFTANSSKTLTEIRIYRNFTDIEWRQHQEMIKLESKGFTLLTSWFDLIDLNFIPRSRQTVTPFCVYFLSSATR